MSDNLHLIIIEQNFNSTLVELPNGERQRLFDRARINIVGFSRGNKIKVNVLFGPGKRIEQIREIIAVK